MANSKASTSEPPVQERVHKPNPKQVLMSVDSAASSRTKYYDVDLESQQDIGAKNVKEKDDHDEKKKSSAPAKSSKNADKIKNASPKSPKKRLRRKCNVCWLYVVYIGIIVAIALTIVVVKLIPKNPSLSFGNVSVETFVYNASSAQITTSLRFEINVTNRNFHAGEVYHDINLAVFYRDDLLRNIPLPAFRQRRKSTTTLIGGFQRSSIKIHNQPTADRLTSDLAKSNVQLELRGEVTGKHKVLGLNVKKFNIPVRCKYNVNSELDSKTPVMYSCYYNA